MTYKPGDLVRITDWDANKHNGWNPMGLVVSEPQVMNHGTTCVIVDWIDSPDTEWYSIHYLEKV